MAADNNKYYLYLPKDSSRSSFKTVSADSYNSAVFGDSGYVYYPLSSSIDVKYYYENQTPRKHIYALINALNRNCIYSTHYAYSSSFGDKSKQELSLISIPGIFFGSAIQKGSVQLSFFVSGTLIGKLEDNRLNGELVQTTGSGSGSIAGVVLYNEGFIVLTGSWNLDNSFQEGYKYYPDGTVYTNYPKWVYWGAGFNRTGSNNQTPSSSFDINFKGTNYVPTITMLAHLEKEDGNHSNNLTYIKYGELAAKSILTGSSGYSEPDNMQIKNTVKYAFDNYTGSLEKQTFITKIGIYDEKKNLIAVAKPSKPVRKTENRNFTFKLKLDI